jgi:hypothetical protein
VSVRGGTRRALNVGVAHGSWTRALRASPGGGMPASMRAEPWSIGRPWKFGRMLASLSPASGSAGA